MRPYEERIPGGIGLRDAKRGASHMKYCNECGARLLARANPGEPRWFVCSACSKPHYRNPCIVVGCLAHYGGRILMCRRAEEPARGLWSIPSGYLECGETLEQATAREILEETGVSIDPAKLDLYNVINMTDVEQVCILFRIALPEEPAPSPGRECLEVGMMSEEQIARLELAWPPSLEMETRDFFQQLRLGEFTIRLVRLGSPGAVYACRSYPLLDRAGSCRT
jgi:ADP-ribose pyrophosphatase YjhB (NUDIX family)